MNSMAYNNSCEGGRVQMRCIDTRGTVQENHTRGTVQLRHRCFPIHDPSNCKAAIGSQEGKGLNDAESHQANLCFNRIAENVVRGQM